MEKFYASEEDGILLDEEWRIIENTKRLPYMLFHSLTNVFPMTKYEEELEHINDYVYHNEINLDNMLKDKRKKTEKIKNSKIHGEYYGEEIIFSESDEATWEWLIETIGKCNNIVLFLSFIEGALKEIYDWFSEEKKYKGRNKPRGISNIEYYIKEIGTCCNYDLYAKLEEELKIITIAKRIRNVFVHEWDAYYNEKSRSVLDDTLKNFQVIKLIDSISKMLHFCEYAGVKGEILEKEENEVRSFFTRERIERIKEEFDDSKIIQIVDDIL